MTKEDLNRQFGVPEKQKAITPPDLLAAAHLIREYCNTIPRGGCKKCIFHGDLSCALFEQTPDDWELSDAEHRTADWIDKQYPFTVWNYIDTDTE